MSEFQEKSEKRIYVIDCSDVEANGYDSVDEIPDDKFKALGLSYSIDGFINAFNNESLTAPCPDYHYLRLI